MIISLLLLFFLLFIMSHKLTNKFKLSFSIFVKLLRRKYLLKLLVILLFQLRLFNLYFQAFINYLIVIGICWILLRTNLLRKFSALTSHFKTLFSQLIT